MVFVTGGTGLVGCYLLLALAKEHTKIKAFKRATSDTSSVEAYFMREGHTDLFGRIEWVGGDLLDLDFLADQLKDVDTIYHTAAYVSFDEREKQLIYTTNCLITEAIVNEAIARQIKRLIFISSIATMDDVNLQTKMIDERSSWNTAFKHSSYAISKFRAEMEVWRASQEGVQVIVVNPGVIIGSLNGQRASEAIFDRSSLLNRFTPTGGTGFIDVRDVVKIVLQLVEKETYNEKFVLVAENHSYKDVLQWVGELNKQNVKHLSKTHLRMLYFVSQINRLWCGKTMSIANYKSLTQTTSYDQGKVKDLLNYKFITTKESLAYHHQQYTEQNIRK